MVNSDGEVIFVHIPQALKNELSEETRVGEHKGGSVGLDRLIELIDRPTPGMTTPWHAFFDGEQNFDFGVGTLLAQHKVC